LILRHELDIIINSLMRASSGVTVAKAQTRRDTLMHVLPKQAVVG
jgi:hypothetical protein